MSVELGNKPQFCEFLHKNVGSRPRRILYSRFQLEKQVTQKNRDGEFQHPFLRSKNVFWSSIGAVRYWTR